MLPMLLFRGVSDVGGNCVMYGGDSMLFGVALLGLVHLPAVVCCGVVNDDGRVW